jgi:hypothetical protein
LVSTVIREVLLTLHDKSLQASKFKKFTYSI